MLTYDKVDLGAKDFFFFWVKEEHEISIKESIQHEHMTNLNMYAPNKRNSKNTKQNLI